MYGVFCMRLFGMFLNMTYATCLCFVCSPLRHDGGFEGHCSVCWFVHVLCNLPNIVFSPHPTGGSLDQQIRIHFRKCVMDSINDCVFAPSAKVEALRNTVHAVVAATVAADTAVVAEVAAGLAAAVGAAARPHCLRRS